MGRRGRGTPSWGCSSARTGCWADRLPSQTSPQWRSCEASTTHRGCARHVSTLSRHQAKTEHTLDFSSFQQLRFQPVVDPWMIQFCHPGSIMEGTEDLSIRLGDCLASTEKKAATSGAVLLQRPAVGTVIGVLGQGAGHQRSKQEYSHSV